MKIHFDHKKVDSNKKALSFAAWNEAPPAQPPPPKQQIAIMRPQFALIGIVLTVWLSQAPAQISLGNPLSGLERLKDFEAMRASSSDPNWRNGNDDSRPIEPGGTLVIADLKGPGVITHIWNTIADDADYYSRLLTLRIYWDDEQYPSVECPIGDFFGIGHGLDRPFTSIPIRVSSDGRGRNCYWPMPFRESARITVTNEGEKRCDAFYYYVDWQKHHAISKETAYFHAMYRQEYPCVMGRNYLIADIQGRGHYVGTIQSVQIMSPGWYGEGDDFFFIDGEITPRLRGTGTEDYFCDGWGFRQQDGPFYGTPLWEGFDTGNRSTAYRFHVPDPIPFKKSLRVEIEHKGSQTFPDGKSSGFIERDDLMSSVGIWYQLEPHKPWRAIPLGPQRLAERAVPLVIGWQALSQAKHSNDPIQVQNLPGVSKEGKQLFFTPTKSQAWVECPFKLTSALSGHLWGRLVRAPDYGIYQVTVDGTELGLIDLYADTVTAEPENWGIRKLAAGEHVLRFECKSKSPRSKGYFLGIDMVTLAVPVYERPPGFDLRSIQK
jgi:hypothetical protein